jgi:hypothetical protein
MRVAASTVLLLVLSSSPALALCAGQSPSQEVFFEDRFADNGAGWFLDDRDLTSPAIGDGVMTIEAFAAAVVPKRRIDDSVPRAADICLRFSWPPTSSDPKDVPRVGIITHATLNSDRIGDAEVRALDRNGTLQAFFLPPAEDYPPKEIAQVSEAGTGEVELRVVTTLTSGDGASPLRYATEKYFINGKEISPTGDRSVAAYDDSKAPDGAKQGYGIFVGNRAYLKGAFPIRYFNVLSPN